MRFSVLLAALCFAVPASAQAAEGDIIVIREPGADARDVRSDAGVELVKPLPIERAELALDTHDILERLLNGFALSLGAKRLHRLRHQGVVNFDIRPHVYDSGLPYT